MPAISPQRLQVQADQLAQTFDRPVVLLTRLHDLLERYADHTRRTSGTQPPTILPTYHTPRPVLRAILAALRPYAARNPQQTLALSDALWDDTWLETRLLAVMLLTTLPAEATDAILERARRWAEEESDPLLLDALVDEGLRPVREHTPNRLLPLVEAWLNVPPLQAAALQLMATLIQTPRFENLPPLVRLLRPWLERPPLALRSHVKDILTAIARRWPPEGAFLLHRLEAGPPGARALARQVRASLPQPLIPGESP